MLTWTERENLRAAAGLPRPPSSRLLRSALPSVERFIHHELVLMEREDKLPPGWITAEEVLDRVVAFACEPNDLPTSQAYALAHALEQEALSILHEAAEDAAAQAETSVPLDEDIPELTELEVSLQPDQGISEFWQPDEDLLRSDQFGDVEPTDPESFAADQQARRALTRALFTLTKKLRRLFSSAAIDGWSHATLAAVQGRKLSDVHADLDEAASRIAAQLSQGDETWTTERVMTAYAALGERVRGERTMTRIAPWRRQTRDGAPDAIDKTAEKTRLWLDDVTDELHWGGRRHAWHATGAVLHALRDQLVVVEAAQLAAQLPMLLRGLFFERWQPAPDGRPTGSRHAEDFLRRVAEDYRMGPANVDPEELVRAVLTVLSRHVSSGEIGDVLQNLPAPIRALCP